MDDSFPLALIAFFLQFGILTTAIGILNCKLHHFERGKCRCSSQTHSFLDPINV
jgi:hypothetical protein